MNELNQATISEISTRYDVDMTYHSVLMAGNYDASITVLEENDNRITLLPRDGSEWNDSFKFKHSDPDRVIAVAQMMLAAAQMVKNHNAQTIDTNENE